MSLAAVPAFAAQRPNIILALADDLGWGDTGYNRNRVVQTPNLDAMAAAGIRFNRFYSGAPVCSPTRGSCLTGRHPYRYGIFFANADSTTGGPSKYALPRQEVTIAEALKPLGYATAHFGKWHLGDFAGPNQSSPSDHGFDEWFSTIRKVPTVNPDGYWDNGKVIPGTLKGDDSRILVDRALRFIRKAASANQPFLVVLWFHTPHLPVLALPKQRARYASHTQKQQHYWGAITAMDEQIGRLRAELRCLRREANTMFWFASDNGPEGDAEGPDWPGTAGPWRGRKRSLFEGGIRVPAILEWPARVPVGRVTDVMCSTSDYYPTILDCLHLTPAGQPRPLDGVSLMPLIANRMKERSSALGFETMGDARGSPNLALIENRYKLLSNLDGSPDFLFDLSNDPGETRNLAAQHPGRVRNMRRRLISWRASCKRSNEGSDYAAR